MQTFGVRTRLVLGLLVPLFFVATGPLLARTVDPAPPTQITDPTLAKKKLELEIETLQESLTEAQLKAMSEKKRLELQDAKLKTEEENSERDLFSRRGWLNMLFQNAAIFAGLIAGLVGLAKYFQEKKEEFRKREDERFENVVTALGDAEHKKQIGAALLLVTFLGTDYERFYEQVFNLSVGYLSLVIDDDRGARDSWAAVRRSLVRVFVDSYSRSRANLIKRLGPKGIEQQDEEIRKRLNATGVRLNRGYLAGVDLSRAVMREAHLEMADFTGASLSSVILDGATCTKAIFTQAVLDRAMLIGADFTDSTFKKASLSRVIAQNANFALANLSDVTMRGGDMGAANFKGADLSGGEFREVNFVAANGKRADLEEARDLNGAKFIDVVGLTDEQTEKCSSKGAEFLTGAEWDRLHAQSLSAPVS